jgi:hypothetical protein
MVFGRQHSEDEDLRALGDRVAWYERSASRWLRLGRP